MTKPSMREVLKPAELLGLAGAFGIFAGLITLMATRSWVLTVVFLLVAFILGLVFLALFAMAAKPNKREFDEIHSDDGIRPDGVDDPRPESGDEGSDPGRPEHGGPTG